MRPAVHERVDLRTCLMNRGKGRITGGYGACRPSFAMSSLHLESSKGNVASPHTIGKSYDFLLSITPGTRLGMYEITHRLAKVGTTPRDRKSTRLNSSHLGI